MKIIRHFLKGLREIGRELSIIKAVVKPKKVELPRVGATDDVAHFIKKRYDLKAVHIFDENGAVVASTEGEDRRDLFEMALPLLTEMGSRYIFLRLKKGWTTIFRHRGLVVLVESDFVPEVVDIWIIKRDLDRFMWGYAWEG